MIAQGVKIASIWNISYQFIYQLTDLNCASLTDQAITQKYMCLLSYADNTKIGGRGCYTIFPRQLKSKKSSRYLQTNYRSLQMNKRYLQTSQHIPIRYSIEKVRKEGQNRFLMARPFDSEEGGLQILSGQGGGEGFAQVVLKCWFKREAEDNFPRNF